MNFPVARPVSKSSSNVSFMPESFAPPQPKQWLAGFGSRMSLVHMMFRFFSSLSSYDSSQFRLSNRRSPRLTIEERFLAALGMTKIQKPRLTQKPFHSRTQKHISYQGHASDQRHAAALCPANSALTLAHFDAQKIGERGSAARQFFFVQIREAEAQGVRQMRLHVKISAGSEEQPALFGVDQEFTGVKSERKFKPQAHAAFGTPPARFLRHVFAKRLIERGQTRGIKFAHLGKMF